MGTLQATVNKDGKRTKVWCFWDERFTHCYVETNDIMYEEDKSFFVTLQKLVND